jgi:hypothetical protein
VISAALALAASAALAAGVGVDGRGGDARVRRQWRSGFADGCGGRGVGRVLIDGGTWTGPAGRALVDNGGRAWSFAACRVKVVDRGDWPVLSRCRGDRRGIDG